MALSATSVLPRNLRAAAKRESGAIQVYPLFPRMVQLYVPALADDLTSASAFLDPAEARRLAHMLDVAADIAELVQRGDCIEPLALPMDC